MDFSSSSWWKTICCPNGKCFYHKYLKYIFCTFQWPHCEYQGYLSGYSCSCLWRSQNGQTFLGQELWDEKLIPFGLNSMIILTRVWVWLMFIKPKVFPEDLKLVTLLRMNHTEVFSLLLVSASYVPLSLELALSSMETDINQMIFFLFDIWKKRCLALKSMLANAYFSCVYILNTNV